VQLIIPDGKERRAREFYVDVLGFTEIVRPGIARRPRRGLVFATGAVHLHLGSERDFHPTDKGHPAWLVPDLDAVVARCESAGPPHRGRGATPRLSASARVRSVRESAGADGESVKTVKRFDGQTAGLGKLLRPEAGRSTVKPSNRRTAALRAA
jgi:catechol 2,3-dioxygenase-like lactoylglutathione lyase family enzyme